MQRGAWAREHTLNRQQEGRLRLAYCPICKRSMKDASSCIATRIEYDDGVIFDAVPFGEETSGAVAGAVTCPDCGVKTGGLHHFGCEIEECPRCRGRLVLCHCGETSDVVDLEVWGDVVDLL